MTDNRLTQITAADVTATNALHSAAPELFRLIAAAVSTSGSQHPNPDDLRADALTMAAHFVPAEFRDGTATPTNPAAMAQATARQAIARALARRNESRRKSAATTASLDALLEIDPTGVETEATEQRDAIGTGATGQTHKTDAATMPTSAERIAATIDAAPADQRLIYGAALEALEAWHQEHDATAAGRRPTLAGALIAAQGIKKDSAAAKRIRAAIAATLEAIAPALPAIYAEPYNLTPAPLAEKKLHPTTRAASAIQITRPATTGTSTQHNARRPLAEQVARAKAAATAQAHQASKRTGEPTPEQTERDNRHAAALADALAALAEYDAQHPTHAEHPTHTAATLATIQVATVEGCRTYADDAQEAQARRAALAAHTPRWTAPSTTPRPTWTPRAELIAAKAQRSAREAHNAERAALEARHAAQAARLPDTTTVTVTDPAKGITYTYADVEPATLAPGITQEEANAGERAATFVPQGTPKKPSSRAKSGNGGPTVTVRLSEHGTAYGPRNARPLPTVEHPDTAALIGDQVQDLMPTCPACHGAWAVEMEHPDACQGH